MKRLLLLFLVFPVLLAGNVFDLFEENMNRSSDYWSAVESFKEKDLSYRQYTGFWNPEVSVSLGTNGIIITEDGVQNFSVSPIVNFVNVYGFKLGLSFPISVNTKDWSANFEGTQLSVSRGLKEDYMVNRLQAEAGYLSALYSLKSVKNSIFIQTVQDVFDWYYYTRKIEILSQRLQVLREKLSKTVDEDEKESLEKQILSVEQTLRNTKLNLEAIHEGINEEIYRETKELLSNITLPATTLEHREDLKALEIQKKAEEIEKKTWFLPYLPDLSFSFNYDFEESTWSIGIGLQLTLWDFGERKLEAEKRKFQIVSLEYEEKIKEINDSINKSLTSIDNLRSQMKQEDIELNDLREVYETNRQLFEKGFLSEEDFILSELDYTEGKLTMENLENSLILEKLKYISTLGYDLEKFLKEGDLN
ncbi:membrane protein [Thermotoga sp. RQ7]|uniref:TolC family protein n=1 Tax=Thermotoga sp. RQ7 TaxID=126738 RepID=UPI0005A335F4|nr:TolC family protein [Thermotoga sp. RQ7]AJG40417.1 membrane protein [Thermotoga sp. RQ7]